MNVTFRFCFRSPLKSLKLPVFKGLSTDLGSHSFLHISFYPLYIGSEEEDEDWQPFDIKDTMVACTIDSVYDAVYERLNKK